MLLVWGRASNAIPDDLLVHLLPSQVCHKALPMMHSVQAKQGRDAIPVHNIVFGASSGRTLTVI